MLCVGSPYLSPVKQTPCYSFPLLELFILFAILKKIKANTNKNNSDTLP